MPDTVKINGVTYALADLNNTAKTMLRNLEVADARLAQLRQEAEMLGVARQAFIGALAENLPKQPQGSETVQ